MLSAKESLVRAPLRQVIPFKTSNMVTIGKRLKESQIQEWKGYYMDYKFMKKKVNQFKQQVDAGTHDHSYKYVLKGFSRILDDQENPVRKTVVKRKIVQPHLLPLMRT
ncbi:hypothetical protein YC2023_060608 [Brassica napus]